MLWLADVCVQGQGNGKSGKLHLLANALNDLYLWAGFRKALQNVKATAKENCKDKTLHIKLKVNNYG